MNSAPMGLVWTLDNDEEAQREPATANNLRSIGRRIRGSIRRFAFRTQLGPV